jgi:hypothetical protein
MKRGICSGNGLKPDIKCDSSNRADIIGWSLCVVKELLVLNEVKYSRIDFEL